MIYDKFTAHKQHSLLAEDDPIKNKSLWLGRGSKGSTRVPPPPQVAQQTTGRNPSETQGTGRQAGPGRHREAGTRTYLYGATLMNNGRCKIVSV